MAMMHCFDSLNAGGRGCVLVKEDFLVDGGDVGAVREYVFENAKNFSIVSLPRKMFEPYTPTKTSIVYFEKKGERDNTFFYIVKNVGHALTSRKKPTQKNDLPNVLDSFNEGKIDKAICGDIVKNTDITKKDYSLWFYDYFEEVPFTKHNLDFLGKYIEERNEVVLPNDFPDDDFDILGVNNVDGVFFNETLAGADIKQKYKKIYVGDLVYNPHRVNVGSIGIVPEKLDGRYISNIYVVFHSKNPEKMPPELLHYLMKTPAYKRIIEAYDTRHGAVRANLTYEMLCRIKVPLLTTQETKDFMKTKGDVKVAKKKLEEKEKTMQDYISSIVQTEQNPNHETDFDNLLTKAALGYGANDQTSA